MSSASSVELLDIVRGEETLAAAAAARPPVCVGLIDDFDYLSGGERQVVRLLGCSVSVGG